MISSFVTLPSGRVGRKGRRGGRRPRTLRVGFAGEPWANAQRLIWSVAELARVWADCMRRKSCTTSKRESEVDAGKFGST